MNTNQYPNNKGDDSDKGIGKYVIALVSSAVLLVLGWLTIIGIRNTPPMPPRATPTPVVYVTPAPVPTYPQPVPSAVLTVQPVQTAPLPIITAVPTIPAPIGTHTK